MNKDDNKKFLNDFFEFLESDSGESLDELKDELKEVGIDFDASKARLQDTLSKLIQKRKSEIRGQERKQMLEERAEFEHFQKEQELPKDLEAKREEINRIRSEYPDLELKLASRKFENISDNDLGKILIELRALIKKENFND